jgi:hypothetical protein
MEIDPSDSAKKYFLQVYDNSGIECTASQIEVLTVIYRGDYLGVCKTPDDYFVFLLPRLGDLWGEIPIGLERYVGLPSGLMKFTCVQLREKDQEGAMQIASLNIAGADFITAPSDLMKLLVDLTNGDIQPTKFATQGIEISNQEIKASGISRRQFLRFGF